MSTVQILHKKGLIKPPNDVLSNTHYETMMGSIAYGVSSDASDVDVYGFCIPRKEVVFPHLAGYISGFGNQPNRFDQYQQHHIKDPGTGKEYDLAIYNIVKYFDLCMDNNPNMIDSLFTPTRCVLHCTRVGNLVRDNRRKFLHKGSWFKFKGYAYSQLHKMSSTKREGKRKDLYEKWGFDIKFAYHVVRLLSEIEQILTEQDLDLERNREQLKSIRRGEWTEQEIRDWASSKERDLEKLYHSCALPHSPDEEQIKSLLLNCLEEHYGNLKESIVVDSVLKNALRQIHKIAESNM